MAKETRKPLITKNSPLNYTSNTPAEYNLPKKSRQEINRENYQKNKEKRNIQAKERYQQQKLQSQLSAKQKLSKYYEAESIKVLISFKDYTELSKEKMKLWLDFNWTMKDCRESIKEGFADVVAIMKLEQIAGKLVRDYWATAKNKIKQKSRSWNTLTDEEQQRLIRYWGYEKARIENEYLDEEERLEKQSQEYLKEIELTKFHEERGKVKCECWSCEERERIQTEIKQERERIITDYDKEQREETELVKSECGNCYQYRKVDSETGLCKKCSKEYGE